MKYKTTVNPNVKTDWTDAELDLMSDQLNKYWEALQTSPGEVFTDRAWSGNLLDKCTICDAVGFLAYNAMPCSKCPLSSGSNDNPQCVNHKTFIYNHSRFRASKEKLQSRLDYLTAQLQANGLDVVDMEE